MKVKAATKPGENLTEAYHRGGSKTLFSSIYFVVHIMQANKNKTFQTKKSSSCNHVYFIKILLRLLRYINIRIV